MTHPRMTHAWCLEMFEGIARDLADGYKGFHLINLDPLDDADTQAKALRSLLSKSPIGKIRIEQVHHDTPLDHAASVFVAGVGQIILAPTGAMVTFETKRTAHDVLAQRALLAATLEHLRRASKTTAG